MKKIILNLSILAGLLLVSCDSADLPQEQNANNDNPLMQRQRRSSIFGFIQSTRIDNDVNCENNILIFPSWDDYWGTIEKLDDMVEKSCNAFDLRVPDNIHEDKYDDLADAFGFDEDNVLRRLEEDLAFCSLRRKIESLETDWLDRQDDGEWDANEDPDNHFIDNQSERTLLSANAEVIIGDERRGYVYYKFLDDEGNRIEVLNNDMEAITQVSRGEIPTRNPNVVVVTPAREELRAYRCKTRVTQTAYEVSGADRIKRKSKIRRAWGTNCFNNPCRSIFPSKVVAITKGYKKKNGKWRSRRMSIAAGINGQSQNASGLVLIDCIDEKSLRVFKEKRRRRIRVVARSTTRIASIGVPRRYNFSLKEGILFSYHKRGNLIVNKDYNHMPGN